MGWPGASPWVLPPTTQALQGRNCSDQPKELRPYRAWELFDPSTQGVALGYHMTPFQGGETILAVRHGEHRAARHHMTPFQGWETIQTASPHGFSGYFLYFTLHP